jgi:hypothetical protein
MKNRLILGLSLCLVSWLSICLLGEAAEPKDIIRDKSPDGKFALQITKEEQGSSAAIIDLKGKTGFVDLDTYQNFTEEMHLVWSKDSQRVAYFEPDRRGGSTTVYFLKGDKFEAVELPEFPECKIQAANGEEYVKTIEATTKPQKWLGSDTLVLRVHSDELMEKGDKQRSRTCTQIVTVTFDSNHKASVQSAKRSKSE